MKSLASIVLAAWSIAVAPQAVRAQDSPQGPRCSNASLQGSYALSATGTLAGLGGLAVVGTVTYDGNGSGTGTETLSLAGTIFRQLAFTGAYTVNRDCTGSKQFTIPGIATSSFDFVVTPDGSKIVFIQTDSGALFTGTAVRLDAADR